MRRPCLLILAALALPAAAQSRLAPPAWAGHAASPAALDEAALDQAALDQPGPGARSAPPAPAGTGTQRHLATSAPAYANFFGRDYGMRPGSAFATGLLGGFLGAGLGGLLFGGGFFHGMHGGPGVLGVLLQLFVAYMLAVWVYRRLAGTLAPANAGLYARLFYSGQGGGLTARGTSAGGLQGRPITLSPADFRSFEELLHCTHTAWSALDMAALRSMMTPRLGDRYARKLADQNARGERNLVTDLRLLQGDVCEARSDGRTEYATVLLSFSMTDVTLDQAGRVVDGSQTERVTVTEYWSFVRTKRARWLISEIAESR